MQKKKGGTPCAAFLFYEKTICLPPQFMICKAEQNPIGHILS